MGNTHRGNAGAISRADNSVGVGGKMNPGLFFPIRSWVDTPHICEHSNWLGIAFPAVLARDLILSANNLVELALSRLPHSGYISPETLVACLSSLNRLEITFDLGFQSPLSRPDRPRPPPQTRVVLPALSYLSFSGMVDYSEDFLAHIDTPVLNGVSMLFFMDLVFDIPHFKQLTARANRLNRPKAAMLSFGPRTIALGLDDQHGRMLKLEVRCQRIDWQLDGMARVCGQLSPFFSSIERFDLTWDSWSPGPQGKDDMEPTQFLELFQPFTAVRSLYVSKTLVPFIAHALQELVGESTTEVLSNLRDLSLGRAANMQPFIEARWLSGQPVAVDHWRGYPWDW
jgi:hypothetical protein